MKTPLIIMTTFFGIAFCDGAFYWGLPDGFYVLAGVALISSLVWMWILELK